MPVSESIADPTQAIEDLEEAASPVLLERGAPAATQSVRRRRAASLGAAAVCIAALIAILVWMFESGAAPRVGGRPSVAVLPFANLGEAQHDYFADGIAEDLTISLGKFSDLFVIGRNSAFTYKGIGRSVAETGAKLGARYLVEGSVRREGEQVRISAELIDAETGRQLWADRYDRALTGVFEVQDEVVRNIVGQLTPRVTRAELARARSKPPASLSAYDYYLQGHALIEGRRGEDRGAMAAAARELFQKAVALDPHYAPAVEGLASTYAIAWLEPTSYVPFHAEYQQKEAMERAVSLARHAIDLDPYLAQAHATLAWILHWQYRRDEALAEFERARELNPNLADGRFGLMLAHDGHAADGVAYLQRIMRQEPIPPPIYFSYLGNAYFLAGRYEEARQTLKAGIERLPDYRPLYLWLAATNGQAGYEDEARAVGTQALKLNSTFVLNSWLEHIRLADIHDAERLAAGIRKAGLSQQQVERRVPVSR
jgi:adenylate cyclase